MLIENYKVYTLQERPELVTGMNSLHSAGWAKFMLFDEVAEKYFGELPKIFPAYQFVLVNEQDKVIACGNSIPFRWDGNVDDLPGGWDDVLARGVQEHNKGLSPNAVSAIAIVVDPDLRGKKISDFMVHTMKDLVRNTGIKQMVAPVRPSLKHKYPLIPMEKYANWIRDDEAPFDPWLRIHWKSKAEIVRVASESMIIRGTVEQWESWVGMKFPESGSYIIPAGLVPVEMNIEENIGTYVEPNVWMKHEL
ncbi:GNAT family N-acetyltransferase [Fredinandcohnia sp. 179-A 10B2 NHS]|uniref:GNAT family N-acetyltransferase n=1 Tax=Fredinandcohnia sp. 179-A 10B2 NHS TaxID=3235176 RepID=UPI0039A0CC1D